MKTIKILAVLLFITSLMYGQASQPTLKKNGILDVTKDIYSGGLKSLNVRHDGTNLIDGSPGIYISDIGNDGGVHQHSDSIPIGLFKRQFASMYSANFKWNQTTKAWNRAIGGYLATAIELGQEGISFHLLDTNVWSIANMVFQLRHNSLDGGDQTIINNPTTDWAQFKVPIYMQMDSVNVNTHWGNNYYPGLWVRGSLYDSQIGWFDQISSDNKGGSFYFRKMRGTVAGGKTAIVDRDTIFRFVFQAKDSVTSPNNDYLRTGAMIAVLNDSNFTNTTSMPMRIDFMTAPTGTVVPVKQFSVRSNAVYVYNNNFFSRGIKPINNDTYSLGGSGASWWSGWFGEGGLNINGTFYVNVTSLSHALAVAGTTGDVTIVSNKLIRDSLVSRQETSLLADSLGVITLATGVAGWGEVMAGDNQEWAHFRFSADGTVTLITNTANVTTTVNTVDKLNIYDAGSGVAIQNNLGAAKKVSIDIKYFTP